MQIARVAHAEPKLAPLLLTDASVTPRGTVVRKRTMSQSLARWAKSDDDDRGQLDVSR